MEFKVVEVVALIILVCAFVLLGLRVITFEQAVTLISIAISLVTGKYVSKYEGRIAGCGIGWGRVWTVLAIAGLVIGIFFFWGGEWIIWDWINSIVNGPWIDWNRFCREWQFYAPLFVYKWTCETWTGPFDLGKGWIDAGGFLIVISAFSLGYLMRPVIEALVRKLIKKG